MPSHGYQIFPVLARLSLVCVLGSISVSAHAADRVWNDSCATKFFEVASCWAGGQLPGETDQAVFDRVSSYNVFWGSSTAADWASQVGSGAPVVTNLGLLVRNGDVTLESSTGSPFTYDISQSVGVDTNGTLNVGALGRPMVLTTKLVQIQTGGRVNVNVAGSELQAVTTNVGQAGTGTLTIENGGAVADDYGTLGENIGSTGIAWVKGPGSIWTTTEDLVAGSSGTGTLTIEDGGAVRSRVASLGATIGSTGNATVTGEDSIWYVREELMVGPNGTGTLTIENGGTVIGRDVLVGANGAAQSGTGNVTVSGAGSALNPRMSMLVGAGTLTVTDGGSVHSAYKGSIRKGSALVTGVGSTWFNNSGLSVYDGTLTIENGGVVRSGNDEEGDRVESAGTVLITGAGSAWDAMALQIYGTATIENGGALYGRYHSYIRSGTVLVNGAGSIFSNARNLSITSFGAEPATLTIENGGTVVSDNGFLGNYTGYGGSGPSGSTDNVTVTGTGSAWVNHGDLQVGDNLNHGGNLTVNAGGLVNNGGVLAIWDTGTVNLAGGTLATSALTNNGAISASGTSTVAGSVQNVGAGIVALTGGTTTFEGPVTNNGASFQIAGSATRAIFEGAVSGATGFSGDGVAEFRGGYSPGNSPALVTMEGDAVFASDNTLVMELAGWTPGTQYDVLDIASEAWLGGTLKVDLLGAFNPALGNSFDIIFAEVLHGAFGSTDLPTLDPGLRWNLQYILNPTGDDIVRISAQLVPIPPAFWLFGSALGLIGVMRRKIGS